jgi:hypothetical protein
MASNMNILKKLGHMKPIRHFYSYSREPAVPLDRKPKYLSAYEALKRTLNCGKYNTINTFSESYAPSREYVQLDILT